VSELPLYEYQCPVDGTFELMQKFSDPPLAACPKCGGPVEKLLSAPAIQFKGTGWYITDYARKSSGADAGKEKGSSEKSSDKKAGESSAAKDSSASSTTTTATSTPSKDKK
jgi:putative FmdB family regulatory protein